MSERRFYVAEYRGCHDNKPRSSQVSAGRLVALIGKHAVRPDKDGPAISPAKVKEGATRKNQNVQWVSALVADLDGYDYAAVRDDSARWAHVAWTTHNHMNGQGPKWRILFPLAKDVRGADWPSFYVDACAWLLGETWDPACKDASRLHYLPSCPAERQKLAQVIVNKGDLLDPSEVPQTERKHRTREEKPGGQVSGLWAVLSGSLEDGKKHTQLRDFTFAERKRGRSLDETKLMIEGAVRSLDVSRLDGMTHDEVVRRYHADAEKVWAEVEPEPQDTLTASAEDWPDPMPLATVGAPRPYPVDCFPPGIAGAIEDAVRFAQCPPALAGCSALSALSLVVQGVADVRRMEHLEGPCSLYVLAVADSGERKTQCDNLFLQSVRDWEREQLEASAPALRQYKADLRSWQAKTDGLALKLKEASRNGKPTAQVEQDMRKLGETEPDAPRSPSLLSEDVTPERFGQKLNAWPSGAVVSHEGGRVFGGHAMGKDTLMRWLSLLNVAWDGKPLKVDRVSSESFHVEAPRVTVGLAVQRGTLATFLEQDKGLSRDSGFLSRFLVANPQSTMGTRFIRAGEELPPLARLDAFHRRLRELLAMQITLDQSGQLPRTMLGLSRQGMDVWVGFYNDVERELGAVGSMRDIKDVAAKAADNAARMAALFHVYEVGPHGLIGPDHVELAETIVAWHLDEARRFYGEIAMPQGLREAQQLEDWLRGQPNGQATLRDVQRLGPYALRNRECRDQAVAELESLGRARLVRQGKSESVRLHPSLVEGR